MRRFIDFPLCRGTVVIVVYANSAIFQLYHGENKLIFNEMMMMMMMIIMRSALY